MLKVAVIGECMLEYFQVESNYRQSFGGDSFNCAVYLQRTLAANKISAQIEYITVLGQDLWSNKMLDFFHQHHLNTSFVDRIADKTCGLYLITTDSGERSFSYWRSDSAAKQLLLTKSWQRILTKLIAYDLIYFSAISLAIMTDKGRTRLWQLLKLARNNGAKIAFDANYRPRLYSLPKIGQEQYLLGLQHSDIFLPSIEDEQNLWLESNPEIIITKAKQAGCNEIIIKNGGENVIFYYQNQIETLTTTAINNIVDSTAAGDSFNGAYLASRLQQHGIKTAVASGQTLAAKVIMFQGAIMSMTNRN